MNQIISKVEKNKDWSAEIYNQSIWSMNSHLLSGFSLPLCLCIVECKRKKKTKLSQLSTQNHEIFEYAFIGLSVVVLIGVLIYLLNKRSQLMRAEKLRSIKRALEVKEHLKKQKPCTMTQMQKEEAIAWFTKNNWILQEFHGYYQPRKIPLKIISAKRKQQPVDGSKFLKDYYDAFYVEMTGGSTMVFGVIMFEKYYPTILFEKSVSNSKNQLGNYNYKFFDGVLKKGRFEGRWYVSDDTQIQQEKQALKDKLINNNKNTGDQTLSERSFSHDRSSDDLYSIRPKTQRGYFKLYHN